MDDNRVDNQILPFFQNPENCSPTALIVALRKQVALGGCKLQDENIAPGSIVNTILEIELKDSVFGTDELFEAALEYVTDRLASDATADTTDENTEN